MASKHAVVPLLFAVIAQGSIPDVRAASIVPQAIVVRYRADAAQSRHARAAIAQRLQLQVARQTALDGEVLLLEGTPDAARLQATLQALRADPAVLHAEPDVRLFPATLPDDPLYATHQWHLHDPVGGIDAPAAWAKSTGAGVVVAVLDTGIVPHADLDANVLPGYDFISDIDKSRRPTPGRAAGALDRGDWSAAGECSGSSKHSSWHGTHVAGTVAQVTRNGLGGAGVAFDARVLPVRVLGKCGGDLSDVADAIVWAAGGAVPDVPANATPAEVINLSLGGYGRCSDHPMLQAAIDTAVGLGATVVIAAGNAAMDTDDYVPAGCSNAVVVGATRQSGAVANYTNYGASVDLSAPGGHGDKVVWQAWHDSKTTPTGSDAYAGMAGTSMAAPHVAGVVALMQSAVQVPLAPHAIERALRDSTRVFPVRPPSWSPSGVGIVDASAAIDAARREADCLAAPHTCNAPHVLIDAVPVPALAGDAGVDRLFRIEVPHDAKQLRFTTYGGTGNVAIDVKRGAPPTDAGADYRADRVGNNETLRIGAPAPGTWFLRIRATAPYAGVTTQARLD